MLLRKNMVKIPCYLSIKGLTLNMRRKKTMPIFRIPVSLKYLPLCIHISITHNPDILEYHGNICNQINVL